MFDRRNASQSGDIAEKEKSRERKTYEFSSHSLVHRIERYEILHDFMSDCVATDAGVSEML